VTEEYTETHGYVPFLEGKSSVGRLGIDIHSTAGKGDEGFCNYWTLEMSVKLPVRIYAGMPVGQLIYFEISGTVRRSYSAKSSAKYRKVSSHPTPSRMYLNFPRPRPPRKRAAPRRT
jgi:dCTP deaminase